MIEPIQGEVLERLPDQEVFILLAKYPGGEWWVPGGATKADAATVRLEQEWWQTNGYETRIVKVMVPR